ncbi:MAG: class I SAM-dependent methyltransferase [Anaerolineales bacterium]
MTDKDSGKKSPKRGWIGGDYFVASHHLQWVSEVLCEAMDLHATERVLDIACGNGNASISAARRGCRVTGIDLAWELLGQADERSKAEHVDIRFLEGDAENLPFADASFDAILSTFGVMFAPDRQQAVSELLRVLKADGEIGLATWWSNTEVRISDVFSRYTPPLSPEPPLNPWTNEAGLRTLFGDRLSELSIMPMQVMYRFPSPDAYADAMLTRYPPWKRIADSLEPDAVENLKSDLIEEVNRHNRSGDETLVSPRDYLQIIGTKS